MQQEFDRIVGIPKEKIVYGSHNMELYFEEDDFDGFLQKLSKYKGVIVLGDGAKEAPWGQRSIRFYDLDEHIIEVGENIGTVIRRFLNSGMTTDEVSKRMDISKTDLEKLLPG